MSLDWLFFSHPEDDSKVFEALFSPAALLEVYNSRFSSSPAKGIDRRNGFQFAGNAVSELEVASRKCLDGSFRFSPYLENLKNKGRKSLPRLIGIPTVRDRVVLHQLNRFLAFVFPHCVPKNVASTYVRAISADLQSAAPDTWVCGCDIRTFYDSIFRERLIALIKKETACHLAMSLVTRALSVPIVPKNAKRSLHKTYVTKRGVPQGLAISNILAAIYLKSVDDSMKGMSITYFRYVDDVLMYGQELAVKNAHKSLKARLSARGLGVHPLDKGKSHIGPLTTPFGYLGYYFIVPAISVRESTVERFLQAIVAKFSEYRHNRARRLERIKYLTEERLHDIFLLELNERITGAISEKKRYGWIAYFNEITDLSLLYRLDRAIERMFSRIECFKSGPPNGIKKLSRAFYEMKFDPNGGYIRNYDKIATTAQKIQFLVERGRVGPDETLTDVQISDRFDKYRRHILAEMHGDEGTVY